MTQARYNLFVAANEEFHNFLDRVDALVHGASDIGTAELRALGRLLTVMAPEIGGTSHTTTVDVALQAQIGEYVANLHALQASLERIRCVMLARKAEIDSARQHVDAVQEWTHAYRQTA